MTRKLYVTVLIAWATGVCVLSFLSGVWVGFKRDARAVWRG